MKYLPNHWLLTKGCESTSLFEKKKYQRLEAVENFKYLGSVISNKEFKPDIISRIAQATSDLYKIIYNITSMARTRMARLPWMIRTRFRVPRKFFPG